MSTPLIYLEVSEEEATIIAELIQAAVAELLNTNATNHSNVQSYITKLLTLQARLERQGI